MADSATIAITRAKRIAENPAIAAARLHEQHARHLTNSSLPELIGASSKNATNGHAVDPSQVKVQVIGNGHADEEVETSSARTAAIIQAGVRRASGINNRKRIERSMKGSDRPAPDAPNQCIIS